MAKRVDIKNVPEELFAVLIEIGKARRETVPATMLRLCSDSVFGPSGVRLTSVSDPSHVRPRTETKKFKPPTVEEAAEEIRLRGYHFGAEEFVAWNGARGWRTRQGPMKDWMQAMVTWETRWKEKEKEQEVRNDGYKTAAERRNERNKELIDRAFREHEEQLARRGEGHLREGAE